MEQCQTLKEYAQYVARVRNYVALPNLSLEEAVERAVTECIKEGILRNFLLSNRAEVVSMSIFEYDAEFEERKLRKDEFDAGVEVGQQELLEKLVKKKLAKGKTIEVIADELEEEVSTIQKLIEKLSSQ